MLLLVTNLHPVTALIKRDHFERAGGFDESFKRGYEDWDLWLRFSERGWRGVRVREPLFNWRRHSENTLVMQATMRHAELLGVKDAYLRKLNLEGKNSLMKFAMQHGGQW